VYGIGKQTLLHRVQHTCLADSFC